MTVQEDYPAQVWLTSVNEDESRAQKITTGKYDGLGDVVWTRAGQIIFGRKVSDDTDIWIMNADGSNLKQLTADAAVESQFSVTRDDRYLVFASNRSGSRHIWRMELDGGNPKQLTDGDAEDFYPSISPDGQWVIFSSFRSGKPVLWKVGINGGVPEQLTEQTSYTPAVSPDGTLILSNYYNEQVSPPRFFFALLPFKGGQPLKLFDPPGSSTAWLGLTWVPDGRAFLYVETLKDVSNIWAHPVDGGAPKQLTNFRSDHVRHFALAPDGKRIAVSRGTSTYDVVLFKDFR